MSAAYDLNELARLLGAASVGPWDVTYDDDDMALVVAAVNALPSMLSDLRRLETLEEEVRWIVRHLLTAVKGYAHTCPICDRARALSRSPAGIKEE